MHKKLAEDYIKRAKIRRKTLDFYLNEKDYPDVVRESQEIVELLLKGVLILYGIEFPRMHDIGKIFNENREKFPEKILERLKEIVKISRLLRKDRELSFYGSEDIIPMEYYSEEDALEAIEMVDNIFDIIQT